MANKRTNLKIILSLLLLALALLTNPHYTCAFPLPHGVDGIIFHLDGITQVPSGINFSVQDISNGEYIQGITGHGSSGRYSVSLNGNDGDVIIIRAWNKLHSTNITVTLQGVMHNLDLNLNMTFPNYPPEIVSNPTTNATQDNLYYYDVDAIDANDDILTYFLLSAPGGMAINPDSGIISWIPLNNQVGENFVEVEVSDGNLSAIQEFTINVANINDPPLITSMPPEKIKVKEQFVYDVNATDPDGDNLIYSLLIKPIGMIINETNGIIKWKPKANQGGNNTVIVQVTDGNLTALQTFYLYVQSRKIPFEEQEGAIEITSSGGAIHSIKKNPESLLKKSTQTIGAQKTSLILKNPAPMQKLVYKYLSPEEIKQQINLDGAILFKVDRTWMSQNNLNETDITLTSYSSNHWEDIQTNKTNEDNDFVYYSSKYENQSYYAITIKEEALSKVIGALHPIISKIKSPFILTGTVYEYCGIRQSIINTSIFIKNMDTNQTMDVQTGVGKNSGAYIAVAHGSYGDKVEITSKWSDTPIFHTLEEDTTNLNFLLSKGNREFKKITGLISFKSKAECIAVTYPVWIIISTTLILLIILSAFINKFKYKKRKNKNGKKRI